MTQGVKGSRRPHGTPARGATCKCEPCRNARAAYQKRRDALDLSRLDPTGTVRRLQALAALGWPAAELGRRLGVTAETVQERSRSTSRADRATAARVRALYDELSMTPGPSDRSRRRALAKGWVPPLAWDDESIDDPTAQPSGAGYRPGTATERVTELVEMGLTNAAIAARLSIKEATVTEYLRRGQVAA